MRDLVTFLCASSHVNHTQSNRCENRAFTIQLLSGQVIFQLLNRNLITTTIVVQLVGQIILYLHFNFKAPAAAAKQGGPSTEVDLFSQALQQLTAINQEVSALNLLNLLIVCDISQSRPTIK